MEHLAILVFQIKAAKQTKKLSLGLAKHNKNTRTP